MKNPNASAYSCFAPHTRRLAALATIGLAVAATTVRAADMPTDSAPKKTVSYGDLNLASPQGVERLYRRIVGAAQQVCHPLDGRLLREQQEFAICFGQSIARAVAAVDQPALTALRAVKTGQRQDTTKLARR